MNLTNYQEADFGGHGLPQRSRCASAVHDSRRDFKVVGGKMVERTDDDPDDEEDGVG
jgi:hypothetical protein